MSFDDYANQIYQKHRLCVALVIIKIKPPNLTTQEYLKHLQSKMADSIDVDDVTVDSDDFMAGYTDCDESLNILRDFRKNNDSRELTMRDDNQGYEDIQTTPSLPENLTQTTYYNSQLSSSKNEQNINNINEQNTFHNTNRNLNNNSDTKNSDSTNIDEITEEDSMTFISNNTKTAKHVNPFKIINAKDTITNNLESSTEYDSQKTIPYTLYGFTQNDSYFSQSQSQIYIPNKYLYAFNNKAKENMVNSNINLQSNLIENRQQSPKVDKKRKIDVFKENVKCNENYTKTSNFNEENDVTNIILENSQQINSYFDEINSFNGNKLRNNHNFENSKEFSQNSDYYQNTNDTSYFDAELANIDTYNLKDENNKNDVTPKMIVPSQNIERITFFSELNNKPKIVEGIDDTNTSELIPYKVLEELNKIKIYLRRNERRKSFEGYTTDSGYRSDSQSRTFNRSSLQSSGICINQSAYCLFNYILRCPLVAATRDITSEIAQTLSDLIDRLHDEETYPPFLEELLVTVHILIRQVYKAKNISESEFLNRDEFIQRALLLNKSVHIQKHCIQKITNILVNFHEKITDTNLTYELTNLDEIENISYIFHILEILIKKYIKNKNIISQTSSQLSQEDKILKKSSITDIWRRKWNTNIRETPEGSLENRCVLKDCSEILNKIIVDCMNSYSLVAYSALKCFNIMQS